MIQFQVNETTPAWTVFAAFTWSIIHWVVIAWLIIGLCKYLNWPQIITINNVQNIETPNLTNLEE